MANLNGMIKAACAVLVFVLVGAVAALAGDVKADADAAINAKDYDKAIKLLDAATDSDPFNDELKKLAGLVYDMRGWDRLNGGDFEGGLSDFRRARVVEPEKRIDTYLGLGYGSFRMKKYDDALYYLNDAAYIDPSDGQVHQIKGEILYQRGKLADAVKELEIAQGLMPDDQGLKERLAKAKKELGVEESFTNKESYYFNIKYEGEENRALGDVVFDVLNKAYSDVGGDLDYYPREPVNVILYTRKQFTDLTEAPSWSGGVFDGNIRIPIGGKDINREALAAVLYHEYTHAVIHMQAGANRVPTWLDEGMAQYEERWVRVSDREMDLGSIIPLSSLEGSFLAIQDPARVKQAYAQSVSAVECYVDKFGRYNLGKLVRLIGEGRGLPDAMRDTTGISLQDFEGLWLSGLRR